MKTTDPQIGVAALNAFIAEGSLLGPLRIMAERLGRFFQLPLPGFKPFIVFGPEAAREVLITGRNKFLWRNHDPVTDLLQHGVLVTDGEEHDRYRSLMEPSLHPGRLPQYTGIMLRHIDRVSAGWQDGATVDMLVESRKIALLIIMETLFGVDAWDDLAKIWVPIRKAIEFISPGPWIIFRHMPRPGYKRHLEKLDGYLYAIISARRTSAGSHHDLLQHLIEAGLTDERIRDQMLTMLIAGHDTSTAMLAWTFASLGKQPELMARLTAEIDATPMGEYSSLLNGVIKEVLRLYPPIHIGNRITASEVSFGEGATIPAGERIFYSIFLTHRDAQIWENADQFCPERFTHGRKILPMSFIPFGGGPRGCIGAAFGLTEARLVISQLLRTFDFHLLEIPIHTHMGATLEPRPGVFMRVTHRHPSPGL